MVGSLILRRWCAVITVVLVATACSGDDAEPPPTSATESTSPTTAAGSDAIPDSLDVGEDTLEIDATPLARDDAIRSGVLDNGLTYYVRSNDAPGGQLQLRLVVRAGSVQEDEPLSGLAHFTEHMLFNGTEAYPRNTLNDVLRSFGSEFGADLNAYTSYDETVYILSVPRTDDDAVTEAFGILDEWAERALLTERDTIEERGVVREEFRGRAESVDGVIFQSFDELYTRDSPYEDRAPIGSEEAIIATTSEQVRDFYDRWYRPELMAVIAVGDLPASRLESEIRDRFSDNAGRGEAGIWEPSEAGQLGEAHVEVIVHPDGPEPYVSLDFTLPSWPHGTVGGERLLLLDEVAVGLVRQRLDDGAARGILPIVRPSVSTFDYTRTRRFFGFNFVADDEAAGLTAVLAELRAMEIEGFGDDEVQRSVEALRAGVDQMLDTAGTRQDFEFAADLVEHFLGNHPVESVEQAHERMIAVLDGIDADVMDEHFRRMMAENAPLVIVVGSDASELPTEGELSAAIAAAETAAAASTQSDGDRALPPAPDAVDEVERRRLDDFDAVELRFANGARVLFRSSEIAAGQVDLLAEASGGWSLLGVGDAPLAGVATNAVSLSGVGDLDTVDLDRLLTGSVVDVAPYIDETVEGFFGSASVDDLELMFHLLHLLVTEPRIDPGPFAEAIEGAEGQARAAQTNPEFASFVELLDARYGGDPWQRILATPDELQQLTAEDALAMYMERFAEVDDLVIAVVGDVDADVVEDLARTYIGSLPSGPPDRWEDRSPDPPDGIVAREVDAGTNDSGAGFDLLMTAEVSLDQTSRFALPVLENLINDLLVEQLREALGASYSGGRVFLQALDEPDALVELVLSVSGDPDRVDEMHALALDLLDSLATDGPTQDQFESAHGVVQSDLDFINNFALQRELLDFALSGNASTTLREQYVGTAELTRADVTRVAARVIDTDRRVEVFRRP